MPLLGGLGGEGNIASLPGLVGDVTVSAFADRSSPLRFDSPARLFHCKFLPKCMALHTVVIVEMTTIIT